MEENNDILLPSDDALAYLAEPMHKIFRKICFEPSI